MFVMSFAGLKETERKKKIKKGIKKGRKRGETQW